jgi:hypothetical protein
MGRIQRRIIKFEKSDFLPENILEQIQNLPPSYFVTQIFLKHFKQPAILAKVLENGTYEKVTHVSKCIVM